MNTAYFPFNELFIEYIKANKKHDMDAQHYHDTYEIYLQLSGKRYLFNNNICYTLNRGDLVIFKPFDVHYTKSRDIESYERYVINFHPNRLSSFLSESQINMLFDNINSCVIHLDDIQLNDMYNRFIAVDEYSKKAGPFSDKLLYSAVFQLIIQLNEYTHLADRVESRFIQPEILNALHYIENHYSESITLDKISQTVHMSRYHFCRLFHNATGATFVEHLSNVRLIKVHKLLIDTDMTLSEIAMQTGFSSSAYLSSVFKDAYKMSPREFRQKTRKKCH